MNSLNPHSESIGTLGLSPDSRAENGPEDLELKFQNAVSLWLRSKDQEALAELSTINSPQAKRLLALIQKPIIRVLAQLPPWISEIDLQDSKFELTKFGYQKHEQRNEPFASIQNYFSAGQQPDFYLCHQIELQDIPPDIQQLNCPVIGSIQDIERHLQVVQPWLGIFDQLISGNHSDCDLLTNLTKKIAWLYPIAFAIDTMRAAPILVEKDIDLLIHGDFAKVYDNIRSDTFQEICSIPDLRCHIEASRTKNLTELLQRSKIVWLNPGQEHIANSEMLYALKSGCRVLCTKHNALRNALPHQDQIVCFESPTQIPTLVIELLKQTNHFDAEINKQEADSEFSGPRLLAHLLRFGTLLASFGTQARTQVDRGQLVQKDLTLYRQQIDTADIRGTRRLYCTILAQESAEKKPTSTKPCLDAARAVTLSYTRGKHKAAIRELGWTAVERAQFDLADALYTVVLTHFPAAMVVGFNKIRLGFHFGQAADVQAAKELAKSAVARPDFNWTIDVFEDVFPYDFFPSYFNYRGYNQALIKYLNGEIESYHCIKRIILASIHLYLGHYENSLAHFRQAISYDPDFIFYHYYYAQQLAREGKIEQLEQEIILLLNNTSSMYLAFELVEFLSAQGVVFSKACAELCNRVAKVVAVYHDVDHEYLDDLELSHTTLKNKITIKLDIDSTPVTLPDATRQYCFTYRERQKARDQQNIEVAELFRQGFYPEVIRRAGQDDWRRYASLALIGKPEEAIYMLKQFPETEAKFYRGVAHWLNGDDLAALNILGSCNSQHARNLVQLISKEKIYVLAQMPWHWKCEDTKFEIDDIGYAPDDLPNQAYANVHNYLRAVKQPDFFVSVRGEQSDIPPNLAELNCPLFVGVADYSVHVQTFTPWLKLFDEIIVSSPLEKEDLERISGRPAAIFPKMYTLPKKLKPLENLERKVDFFTSGAVMSPFYPDKATLVHNILATPGLKAKCIFGFVDDYWKEIAQTKSSLSYVQHLDGMPTRAMEALTQGSVVLVQKGSVFALYADEECGVVQYTDEADLRSQLKRVLLNWDDYQERARLGAEIVRTQFKYDTVISQYLRYVTFLAAKPRDFTRRKAEAPKNLVQKECLFFRGFKLNSDVRKERRELSAKFIRRRLAQESNASLYIDWARDIVLEYATADYVPAALKADKPILNRNSLVEAFRIYQEGIKRFPRNLVLCFNYVRSALHMGRPADVTQALKFAKQILQIDAKQWEVDVFDDVFPYDFHGMYFHYRRYFDLITAALAGSTSPKSELIKIILASLWSYLAHYSKDPSHFAQAVLNDPEFDYYRYKYALSLIESSKNFQQAGDILLALSQDSYLHMQAFQALDTLVASGSYNSSKFQLIKLKMQALIECSEHVDNEELASSSLKMPDYIHEL